MAEQQEQNRSEEPTPFKLKRARDKGMVARSIELGFLGALLAAGGFMVAAGPHLVQALAQTTRSTLAKGIDGADSPQRLLALIGSVYWVGLAPLILLGLTVVAVVVFLEILQLRGLVFSGHPLKPDFSRLNPAKGLKRLFSPRMIKETLKTIAKSAIYAIAEWLVVRYAIAHFAEIAVDGERLPEALQQSGMRLIYAFAAIALFFVIIDQVLVRREFLKQMRMSRRELTREAREREGEPRIKQKRKQLHAEFLKASKSVGALPGSDVVVVNPEHFAVALRYERETMAAPLVSAKGRNRFAQALKDEAFRLGIPIVRRPELARALHRKCETNSQIPADHFADIAALYIDLYRHQSTMSQ